MRAHRHDLVRWGLVAALAALAVAEELLRPTPDASTALRIVLVLAATLPVALRSPRPTGAAAAVVAFGSAVALVVVVGHAPWGVVGAQILLGWALAQSAPGPVIAGSAVVSAVIAALGTAGTSDSGPAPRTWPVPPDATSLPAGPAPASAFFLPEAQPAPLVLGLAVLLSLGVSWALRARHDNADRVESERKRAEAELLHSARGERARIARELHDVVAHHISMISVQAETARLTTPDLHPVGEQRLMDIGDTARTALTEMRRLLGVLRDDGTDGHHGPEGQHVRAPQPGLDQLGELVDAADAGAGTPASLVVHGSPVPLDPGTQLTAFRIVQEGLTNVRRHAPGSTAEVLVSYEERGLHVRVSDDGPGVLASGLVSGHGILGLRERVAMVGGELCLGDGPNGGFVLDALLPTAFSDKGIQR